MKYVLLLLNPGVFAVFALFACIVWMLKDEKDKIRPILLFGLLLNIFFGTFLNFFMAREGALLPWKYDHVLLLMDKSLGVSAASFALPLLGVCRTPLIVVYFSLVPMMIFWLLVNRNRAPSGSLILAYISEMVAGPILYAILPGCGPIYAFGAQWLHPPTVQANAIRLGAMPNAFPSLHVGTAVVFVLFSPNKLWRAISLAFLAGTAMATIATGEHYIVDLIPGLAFGCFAASVGHRRARSSLFYLGVTLLWTLAVRFDYAFLIVHPALVQTLAVLTIALAVFAVCKEWRLPIMRLAETGILPRE